MENDFNHLKTNLTDDDVSAILSIIGYKCRQKTINRLRSILKYGPSTIQYYGIFNRLWKNTDGTWEYCAGQSYTDELRTMRECILKG